MEVPATILVTEGPKPASAWSAIVTLLNCTVGAGVLSFPLAFRCTGWLAGLVVTVLVALTEAFTLYVLSRYAEHTRSSNYSELVRKMLGPVASLFMSIVIFLYIWGSAAAYLIILGDCFAPMLAVVLGSAWYTQRDVVILALACAAILPLCFPRTLTGVSALTLWGLVVLVGLVVLRSVQMLRADPDPWRDVRAFSPSIDFLSALPIFVFGFQCHTNVIAVFDELGQGPLPMTTNPSSEAAPEAGPSAECHPGVAGLGEEAGSYTELPPARLQWAKSRRRLRSPKLQGMVWVVLAAIGITCFFYCCVGVCGYLAFPNSVRSNILTNFPPGDPLMQLARVVVGGIQVASYPVLHNPARAAVRDVLFQLTGLHFVGDGFNATETLLFFSSTLGVSLMVTDLGIVFRLVGGTGGGLLIFTLPGLLLMQYAYGKHALSKQQLLEPLLPAAAAPAGLAGGQGGAVGVSGQPQWEGEGEGGERREGGRGRQAQRWDSAGLYRPGGGLQVYSFWRSKLWWAGVALVLLSVALCALTVYTVLVPTSQT